ncbi:MAG: methyl-accepting chemotaxis sensory transducer [Candidatus Magnetoglobus multicellularis str. Araruama]|uniref:Methyl-accepting chemotaxis sensory transducer n=1 Tax=Candidatus Magnetoglobus multicellularis str. Araruama TaxID=890399 RepID=A0A1V1PBG0_9BACT|nr:MAG: methyl-accepting chemotaxis sensory transducer [Candidatus Magnetoglobus multicellularis str. Araruama]
MIVDYWVDLFAATNNSSVTKIIQPNSQQSRSDPIYRFNYHINKLRILSMIQTFRNLKMGIKIFGGFSIVLLLLLIVAISGYNGLTGVVDSSYKKDSVGQLTQCFSEARQYEKQFIMKNDPGDAKKLGMEITTLTQKANRLKKAFNEKNFHAKMNHVIQAANRYETAFEQFTELRNQKIQKMQDMRQKARDVRIFCESISKDQVAQLKQLRETNAHYITRKIARADDANELVKLALDAKHYRSLIMQGNLDVIDDWKAINQAVYALTQKMKTQFQTQKNIQQTQAIIDQYKSYETQILSFITQYKRSRQQVEFKSSIALGAIEDIQKAQQKQLKNLLARADMNYSQFNLNQLTDKQRKLDEAHRMIRYANMEQNLRQSLIRGELELVDLWKAYIQKLIKISNYIKSLFRNHANIFQAKKVIQRYEDYEHAVLTFIDYYEKTHQAIQKTAITLMETIETVRDDQKSQLDLAQKEFEMKLNNKLSLVTDAHAIVKWFIDARKNEKEFIISGDKKYLNIVQGDIQKIQTLCEKIEGKLEIQKNITQIQSVVAATRAYLETFTNYIALTDKQNISEDNMQKAAQTAQEACQNAFVNQEKMMNEQVNTTETMIILMVVIAIGLGLFISFAITKGVLRPIVKSLDFTRSMADGNFTMKLAIDQKMKWGTCQSHSMKCVKRFRL